MGSLFMNTYLPRAQSRQLQINLQCQQRATCCKCGNIRDSAGFMRTSEIERRRRSTHSRPPSPPPRSAVRCWPRPRSGSEARRRPTPLWTAQRPVLLSEVCRAAAVRGDPQAATSSKAPSQPWETSRGCLSLTRWGVCLTRGRGLRC